MSDWERFNSQFRETREERVHRLRTARQKGANPMTSPPSATGDWADKKAIEICADSVWTDKLTNNMAAALRTAHSRGVEEAAKVADEWGTRMKVALPANIAYAIRSLIPAEKEK